MLRVSLEISGTPTATKTFVDTLANRLQMFLNTTRRVHTLQDIYHLRQGGLVFAGVHLFFLFVSEIT